MCIISLKIKYTIYDHLNKLVTIYLTWMMYLELKYKADFTVSISVSQQTGMRSAVTLVEYNAFCTCFFLFVFSFKLVSCQI
jgi:hypothetical protein